MPSSGNTDNTMDVPMPNDDTDILLSRLVDGEARHTDWEAFETAAAGNAALWRELALAQRQHQTLSREVSRLASAADSVDLPIEHASARREERSHRRRQPSAWAGWGIAALLALAVVGRFWQPPAAPVGGEQQVGGLVFGNPQEALQAYLTEGQRLGTVVGEVPQKVLMSTQPAPGGKGYEVIFVRQIVERTHVEDLYQMSSDELGRAVPLKLDVRVHKQSGNPL